MTPVLVIGLLVIAALAVVALAATRHPVPSTGRLSRETRRRDRHRSRSVRFERAATAPSGREGRTRQPSTSPDRVTRRVPATSGGGVAEEELGITRRQFFNRSILVTVGLGLGSLGAATVAFLYAAPATSGFGGEVVVGSVADVQAAFAKDEPLYSATAKTYIVPYPKKDLAQAEKVAAYTPPIIAGMKTGYVALYQRCVHLGCRVPFCATSQWFECPCHGSKYSKVGEKRAGPAPRGLDRFVFKLVGKNVVVDTGDLVLGPPIGTDTTGQAPEGPLCV